MGSDFKITPEHVADIHAKQEHPRYQKLKELSARGTKVPVTAQASVLNDTPSKSVMGWSWWAHAWPCPNEHNFEGSEWDFEFARKSWEESSEFVKNQLEIRAEIDAQKVQETADRDAEDVARRSTEADQLKAELKYRYMQLPGTTETEFEAAFPELLADSRRRQMAMADEQSAEIMAIARTDFGG